MSSTIADWFARRGHSIRTIDLGEETWLVAQDVCRLCGTTNIGRKVAQLPDDKKRLQVVDHRATWLIGELAALDVIRYSRRARQAGTLAHEFVELLIHTAVANAAFDRSGRGVGAHAVDGSVRQ